MSCNRTHCWMTSWCEMEDLCLQPLAMINPDNISRRCSRRLAGCWFKTTSGQETSCIYYCCLHLSWCKKNKRNMTETRIHRADKQQNGDAMAETSTVDDVFDDTYREKEGKKPPRILVWRNIILMGLLHVGALYGLVLIPSASWLTLGWTAVCYMISALGVTAGAHRLWSHRSYKASVPLRVFLALGNSMAFQNDIYEWARDHRVHHKYSETDADPHNAKRGFFFSHIGWLLVRKHPDVIEKGQKLELGDLRADRVVMFQRRNYKLSVVLLCFLVPTLVPWYFWGESLAVAYFVPGLLRYTVVLNASWLVNSAAHMWGNRPYDKTINPRENPLVAISAIGEGFHNYHHTFPFDYATSEFGCKINITTAFINLMCVLGLANDRKRVSRDMIAARIQRTGDSSYKSG
ncbi:stearoyl-CoA desaturase b [Xiphophorus hellerii]|uniref:stearoyl-CoA desaturase b n=1 Tax=Xiphophorus hellerii TaxID=8084 RepID=UPI0013B4241A|nr:acyl-CoA desaturase-like [Xiphophorus hellerii]